MEYLADFSKNPLFPRCLFSSRSVWEEEMKTVSNIPDGKMNPPLQLMKTISHIVSCLCFAALTLCSTVGCQTTSNRATASDETLYLDSSGNIRSNAGTGRPIAKQNVASYQAPTYKPKGPSFWDWFSGLFDMEDYDRNLARWSMASGIIANQATAATAYQRYFPTTQNYRVTPAGFGAYSVQSY